MQIPYDVICVKEYRQERSILELAQPGMIDMNVDKFKLDLGQMMKPELIQTKPHTNCKFPTQVQSNRLKLGPNRTLL